MIDLRRCFSLLTPFVFLIFLNACQTKEKRTNPKEETSFFTDKAIKEEPKLENRMSEAPTDHLKTYADIPIPFQPWSPDLLELSQKTQKPIFAYVSSANSPASRHVADILFKKSSLAEEFSKKFICSVVSIEQAPEMALLAFHLSGEIKQSVNFPMLLWLTHEGNPIAWLPLNSLQEAKRITNITQDSIALVQDIWENSSLYAIKNSRRDNVARTKRLNFFWEQADEKPAMTRQSAFVKYSREYISLYNPLDKNFDSAGALLPSRTVSFVSLIAQHPALSEEVQNDARTALAGLLGILTSSAMHDPVDGGYFTLSRGDDWSLPLFTKDLSSQSEYGIALFQAAEALTMPEAMQNAIELLEAIEKNMLTKPARQVISTKAENKDAGLFIWSLTKLKKVLTPEEYQLARQLFHLKKLGNIKLESDINRSFLRLNSLPFQDAHNAPVLNDPDKMALYQNILAKLRNLRLEKADEFFSETSIPASSLASLVRLYTEAFRVTNDAQYLTKALKYADILLENYLPKNEMPLRFPDSAVLFRGLDYARCILAFNDLYQLTLDSKWLNTSNRLANEALKNLRLADGRIAEASEESQVMNVSVSDTSMIFTDSSFALLESGLAQLSAITGDKDFQQTRDQIWSVLSRNLNRAYFIKADILQGCAYEDAPIVCVLHGPSDSPQYLALRKIFQNSLFAQTSILTTSADYTAVKLPEKQVVGLTILRDKKIIAEITDPAELDKKLREIIAAP